MNRNYWRRICSCLFRDLSLSLPLHLCVFLWRTKLQLSFYFVVHSTTAQDVRWRINWRKWNEMKWNEMKWKKICFGRNIRFGVTIYIWFTDATIARIEISIADWAQSSKTTAREYDKWPIHMRRGGDISIVQRKERKNAWRHAKTTSWLERGKQLPYARGMEAMILPDQTNRIIRVIFGLRGPVTKKNRKRSLLS